MLEELVRKLLPDRPYLVQRQSVWLAVRPVEYALPEHGWKLHLSCRADDLMEMADLVVPELIDAGCPFKLACSTEALRELNDGFTSPATVGKAFTVYPDQREVRSLGERLAVRLRGCPGPRILSDRRVSADAPVYYRYGPFSARWDSDARGQVRSVVRGPSGERFDGEATWSYRQPSWVVDPFADRTSGVIQPEACDVLAGRFRIASGLQRTAPGNVYRAIDERDRKSVIVKQARALVQERGEQIDARLRLRNERYVLSLLDGLDGIPRFVDHFRYGNDEYLVTGDAGPRNLQEDVVRYGRYRPGDAVRDLEGLASRLARVLVAVQARGIVLQDLAPKNVVVADNGAITLVDFGLAAHDEVLLRGGTPGYAPSLRREGPPRDTDDLYALGITLLYAATGMQPVPSGDHDTDDEPRRRALQQISALYGSNPPEGIGVIIDLLGQDDGARAAARRLADVRAEGSAGHGAHYPRRPAPTAAPTVGPELVAELADTMLSEIVEGVDALLASDPPGVDADLYVGCAGVGLELLRHLEVPGIASRAVRLLHVAEQLSEAVRLPHGLYTGRTGVDLFRRKAVACGLVAAGPTALPAPDWTPEGEDLIVGAAGVGLGHLELHRLSTSDGADVAQMDVHLAVARRCVEAILATQTPGSAFDANTEPHVDLDAAAIDPTAGLAHGLAGPVTLLVAFAEQTADPWIRRHAQLQTSRLAARAQVLLERVNAHTTLPLALSWCGGLTGIGVTLLRAGQALGDSDAHRLALRIADVAADWLPYAPTIGRCCGAAGIGDFFAELAAVSNDERHWQRAHRVVAHMLIRSSGTDHRIGFDHEGPPKTTLSWAHGRSGVLGFLRKLHDRDTSRHYV